MSLNAPNLDDRKFQDIVDDVKRQIALRCPEWTDHNVSDPGVTLIELFAWMMEMMLFRLNQVPEKNYLTFLEMLDITLEPPQPARTDLLYRLQQSIKDAEGLPRGARPSPELEARIHEIRQMTKKGMVAATRRTENEEAIEFTTETDMEWTYPGLTYVLAVPAHSSTDEEIAVSDARDFYEKPGQLFYIFTPPEFGADGKIIDNTDTRPRGRLRTGASRDPAPSGDALYLGFTQNVQRHQILLTIGGVDTQGRGMDPLNPLQRWEVYTGQSANPWHPVRVTRDTIAGFDVDGEIELVLPADIARKNFGGREAFWVRCHYIGNNEYERSPAFAHIASEVTGALVPSANYNIVTNETLGIADGTPGGTFLLRHVPLLQFYPEQEETIRVGEELWTQKKNFADSRADDRHFTCDNITGEIRFGPSILQPDGSARQYGAIPEKGQPVVVTRYRYGGGATGNVREMQICVDKDNRACVAEVLNLDVATGGRDLEDVERAKMRARAMLQMRHRAVTPEDFDFLALQADPKVGRARCLRWEDIPKLASGIAQLEQERSHLTEKVRVYREGTSEHRQNSERIVQLEARSNILRELYERREGGVVTVMLVPAFSTNILVPSRAVVEPDDFSQLKQKVLKFLDEKRLLTTVVKVIAPDYVPISISIELASDMRYDPQLVAYRVKESLNRLIHPLCGGEDGRGWPFGRNLTVADIYTRVSGVEGVAYLTPPTITRHWFNREPISNTDQNWPRLAQLFEIDPTKVSLLPHQLPLTVDHTIRVVPVAFFGGAEHTSRMKIA